MWIEILLLSRLADGPMHGYELRKAIDAATGHSLSNNSLYPTLRRFVDAEAVQRTAEPQQGKPPRHIYTITEVGRELLHDMLADFPEEIALNEAEFLARLGNFSRLGELERLAVLDTRDRVVTAEQDRLAERAGSQTDPWSRAALAHLCEKYAAERVWLAELRDGGVRGHPARS